ncbi:MAG: MBL fold metallo-hydrolase [Alphaproteobacteria bacterium]|nr:MBL fold metallo-hydrolase [Alphaproteobacteria bacterium]MDP6516042.1 MBL fold metallo-hydrolase [Alphaproteobacteria bacterium]
MALSAAVAQAGDYGLAPFETAPGVYTFWGEQADLLPSNGGNIANAGFIVGAKSVLVIDAGPTRRYAEQMLDAIRATTDRPIIAVVVTHHHQDHSFGIPVFVEHGLDVIMHPGAAAMLVRDGDILLNFVTELVGAAWTDGTTIGAPTHPITEATSIDLGDRDVDVEIFEGGHTPGDLVVYDGATKTLFAGDLVFNGRVPTVPHGDVQTWRGQLVTLDKWDWRRLIPGHGPLVADRTVLDGMSDYLAFLEARVACSYRMGDSPAETLMAEVPDAYTGLFGIDREYQRAVLQLFRKYDETAPPPCP